MKKSIEPLERMLISAQDSRRVRIANMKRSEKIELAATTANRFEQSVLAKINDTQIGIPLAANQRLHPTVMMAVAKDKSKNIEVWKTLRENPSITSGAYNEVHRTLAKLLKESIDTMARKKEMDRLAALLRTLKTL